MGLVIALKRFISSFTISEENLLQIFNQVILPWTLAGDREERDIWLAGDPTGEGEGLSAVTEGCTWGECTEVAGERGGAVEADEPPWVLELLVLGVAWVVELPPEPVDPAVDADWLLKSHPVGRSSSDPDKSWKQIRQ